MSMIYHRPVNPQNKCSNCKYLTRIMRSSDGKQFCEFVEEYVVVDSLCPEYARR